MAKHTLLHPELGRFYLDTTKSAEGLAWHKERGFIIEPADLKDVPTDAIEWKDDKPKKVNNFDDAIEKVTKAKQKQVNMPYLYDVINDLMDVIHNTPVGQPINVDADLKAKAASWQGRKGGVS